LQQIIAGVTRGVDLMSPDGRIVWANEAALDARRPSRSELGATCEDYGGLFTLRYRNGRQVPDEELPLRRLCAGESFDGLVLEVRRVDDPEADWSTAPGLRAERRPGRPGRAGAGAQRRHRRLRGGGPVRAHVQRHPAPALIVRVADLRYVRVNQGFLEMTGHRADEIVGRSIYEFDVLSNVEEREIAAARVTGWKTCPQMEAELPIPGGGTRLVIVAGHPIEIADAQCMLFTFADLEPRRRAERSLQQSEERFAKAFRLAPAPMKISTLDGFRILNVNHAFLQLTGWTLEELVGRAPDEIELWDSPAALAEAERRLVQTGGFRDLELKLRTKSGALVDVSAAAETVTLHGESSVLTVLQDITVRRRSESELAEAIGAALQDTDWLSRKVLDRLAVMRRPPAGEGASGGELTPREEEVLSMLAQGRSDAEIAATLSLTRNTVRNHVARVYGKIGAHNRSEAVIWARERGMNSKAIIARRPDLSKPSLEAELTASVTLML
jgi:PAS domain S-box-containing protein